MLVPSHDTGGCVEPQALSLVEDAWVTEVVPRLPADLAEQARAVKAFQRVRSLATPYDLLRLTFRTLFWSSEAMLTAPPKSSGQAIPSADQPTELFVFLAPLSASQLPAEGEAQCQCC